MKNLYLAAFSLILVSCMDTVQEKEMETPPVFSFEEERAKITELLDHWHSAAADADFNAYFDMMAEDGIFIGTDPTENWKTPDFKKWSKPYFDNGKAWDFTALERNIYLNDSPDIAWFDELLDTQMGICRGSGVLTKVGGEWKVKHYVLSMTIPNDNVSEVTGLKKKFDQSLLSQLKIQ